LVVGDGLGGSGAVKADVVRLLRSNQLASAPSVTVNNSGLLDLNGNSNTIGFGQVTALSLTGGSVTAGARTLTLGGNVAGLASTANLTPASISGNLSLGGATRTFDVGLGSVPGSDLAVSAVLSNGAATSGLTKIGTGRLTLSGVN